MNTLTSGAQLLDQDCTIELDGRKFTSGGAFIGQDKNGRLGGQLYAFESDNQVGNWDGSIKINARFCTKWQSNFGDYRQSVYFEYQGVSFYGIYYKTNSDIVRCRQIA